MTITRRVFLTGVAAFVAFRPRPKPPKSTGVYSAIYSNTY